MSFLAKVSDRIFGPKRELRTFPQLFEQFQNMLLHDHQRAMEIMADLGEKAGGEFIFDRQYLRDSVDELQTLMLRMAKGLNLISSDRYLGLYAAVDRVLPVESELRRRLSWDAPYVICLSDAPDDHPELIGGKANGLQEVIQHLHLPVPDGFVITTRAYYRFLEHNHLDHKIRTWIEAWISGQERLSKVSSEICHCIEGAEVPDDLVKSVSRAAAKGKHRWAVRSSAYGEGGELSFAGLHQTFLNTPPERIPETYKMVLASLYSPEAMSYRRQMGMLGEDAAMAVLCQEMVDSQASGVLHTVCLEPCESNSVAIYASFGLGRTAVEGRDVLDRYLVEKDPPYEIKESRIARKEILLRSATSGGEEETLLSPEKQTESTVPEDTLRSLAQWGAVLERYFKRTLEVEWALSSSGDCRLLQCRRLPLRAAVTRVDGPVCEICEDHPILIQDKGAVAHVGVGSGHVRLVQSNEDMAEFPDGAVLVTRYTAPWLSQVVPKATAIISELGSVAGHLATIAREFRVPALIGVEGATEILREGLEITLDTHRRVVYRGRVEELIRTELMQPTVFEETPEFFLLRRIIKRVAHLHLLDPQSSSFTPEGCQSVHDMIRFIHEKAVEELMHLPEVVQRYSGAKVRTLASDAPIGLKILDLGGGLDPFAEGETIGIDQVRSLPLRALWTGLAQPGAWSSEPFAMDFKALVSSLTKNWESADSPLGGYNLAVVNQTYLNLHLRLGYHFNLIDARMDDEAHKNHIYFRFVGGMTDFTRRSRRAQLLADILSQYHFKAAVKGDLIVARILHLPKEEIHCRLAALGALIGFTRQLDLQLRSDSDIAKSVAEFFEKHAELKAPVSIEKETAQLNPPHTSGAY